MISLTRRSERSLGRRIGAWQDSLGRRRPITKRRMLYFGVVAVPPLFHQHPRFREHIEDLGVQRLVAELSANALIVSVFPWRLWLDVKGPSFVKTSNRPSPADLERDGGRRFIPVLVEPFWPTVRRGKPKAPR